ncbi:hypothetical protein ACLBWZ_13045 [Brucellaceae bacterium C25G]
MQCNSKFPVPAFKFSIFFSVCIMLAGCSQTTSVNTCTPTQKNNLTKEHTKITRQITQKRNELIKVNQNISNNSCRRSLFSNQKQSNLCVSQIAKSTALESEIKKLQDQANIYQSVIRGATISHPSLKNDGCSLQSTQRKTAKQSGKTKTRQSPKASPDSAQQINQSLFDNEQGANENTTYKVYIPPENVKISHEIVPVSLDKKEENTPKNLTETKSQSSGGQDQKGTLTGAERPYQPNPKVRVVGSGFYPNPEAATAQPAPDQND